MSVKGEIIITANGSELEGPRLNNSSLIFEFNHKIHVPYSTMGSSREVSIFSIVKDIDKITPQLYLAVDRRHVCEILIKLYRLEIDTGEEEEYLNYNLNRATIVSIENWMPSTKIEANENIGHLEKIEIIADVFIVTHLEGSVETEITRSFDRG